MRIISRSESVFEPTMETSSTLSSQRMNDWATVFRKDMCATRAWAYCVLSTCTVFQHMYQYFNRVFGTISDNGLLSDRYPPMTNFNKHAFYTVGDQLMVWCCVLCELFQNVWGSLLCLVFMLTRRFMHWTFHPISMWVLQYNWLSKSGWKAALRAVLLLQLWIK